MTTAGAGYICGCGTRYHLAAGASMAEQLEYAAACDDHDQMCSVARFGLTEPDPGVLAIAAPAVAEFAALSLIRQTLMRADSYVRRLEDAGVEVRSVDASAGFGGVVSIQVARGMVAAAADVLGWTAGHEVYGDVNDPSERVLERDGSIYAVDHVYGGVGVTP